MGLFRRKSTTFDVAERLGVEPPPKPPAAIRAGVPGRCPDCGGFGYIDHIDLKYNFQTQHCRDCKREWEYHFDDDGEVIDLSDSSRSDRSAPR